MVISESVHGHEILRLLLETPEPLTQAELRGIAAREFGADARYHTCSAAEMTLDDLIVFLMGRGKLSESDGRLIVHRREICNHD